MNQHDIKHRGKWLKSQIKEKGFLMKEISIITGTHNSSIARDLNNETMPFKRMKIICDYIGVNLYDFFPEAEKKLSIIPDTADKWEQKFLKTSEKLTSLRAQYDKLRRNQLELKRENKALKSELATLKKSIEQGKNNAI